MGKPLKLWPEKKVKRYRRTVYLRELRADERIFNEALYLLRDTIEEWKQNGQ